MEWYVWVILALVVLLIVVVVLSYKGMTNIFSAVAGSWLKGNFGKRGDKDRR